MAEIERYENIRLVECRTFGLCGLGYTYYKIQVKRRWFGWKTVETSQSIHYLSGQFKDRINQIRNDRKRLK